MTLRKTTAHQLHESFPAMHVAIEHVEAGARGRKQHCISPAGIRRGEFHRGLQGVGQPDFIALTYRCSDLSGILAEKNDGFDLIARGICEFAEIRSFALSPRRSVSAV